MATISHHSVGAPGGGPSAPHPPLEPCSVEDVASFAALDHSLRSHPELAKEGPAVLNPEALARLVDGIRTFQDEYLGRESKSRRWPFVRLPDHIFRDRSRTGPLYAALISAYRTKSQSSWRNFDMGSNRRFDDNVALMRRMGDDLVAAGFLRRPAIHLDATVPKSRRGGMARIVERFGGKVVSDPADATHVVAHDPRIDGDPADDVDWTHGSATFADDGEDEPEKEFVRTVAVVKDPATGQKMTMAHWWFFPASYDVWMRSKEVAGDAAAEPKQARPASEDGKWVVASRFVRDVARFNEWGDEADYAIVDYHAKVALYKGRAKTGPTKSKKKSSLLTGGKKGSKSKSCDVTSVSSEFSGNSASASKAGESDRKRDRRAGSGMNPRPILTGFYSDSGARLRRIVHDGALRVPPRSVGIVRDSLDLVAAGWDEGERKKWEWSGGSKGKRRIYELPSVDSVARPSLDSSIGPTFLVTELFAGRGGKSVATNRRVLVMCNSDEDDKAERIRGGGETEDIVMIDANAADAGTGPVEFCSGSVPSEIPPAVLGKEGMPSDSNIGPGATEGTLSQEAVTKNRIDAFGEATLSPPGDKEPRSASHDETLNNDFAPHSLSEKVSAEKTDPQIISSPTATPVAATTQDTLLPATDSAGAASNKTTAISVPSLTADSQPSSQPSLSQETSAVGPGTRPTGPDKETAVTGPSESNSVAATAPSSSEVATVAIPKTSQSTPKPAAADQSEPAELLLPSEKPALPGNTKTNGAPKKATAPSSSDEPSSTSAAPVPSASLSSSSVKKDRSADSSQQVAPASTPSTSTTPPAVTALPDRSAQEKSSAQSAETEDSPPIDASAPSWYDPKTISDIEQTMLPEWFNSSAIHRTPESFAETRERIVGIGRRSQGRYITATAVRRVVPGDAGSLLRLHAFLVQWGFLNSDTLGDSAPTMPGLRKGGEKSHERPRPRLSDGKFSWTGKMRNALAKAVVNFATKQNTSKRTSPMGSRVAVDWAAVAAEVGQGATPADCQGEFLSLPLNHSEDDVTVDDIDSSDNGGEEDTGRKRCRVLGRREVLCELLDGACPNVIAAATNAALDAAANGSTSEAQKAAVLGTVGAEAMIEAKDEEDAIERLLMEILDQRMVRLENRVALLDDMEGMLEAERVALELERRDLYTARCRHWFSGGN
eukprot:CAMPEP_0113561844 /NCGR_PEP_ID=MMETSP0015_2-20120614/20199_1 /TAXON_ID=2838 /ORGANISM="Odontella" /LENGTH=1172 /DNA_ID=CAMNT_0000463679 /DNA_START=107 /DNA_END=3625 /DNA_ORIENTATION=+ /assembly_acc=CAM_ASM_000160